MFRSLYFRFTCIRGSELGGCEVGMSDAKDVNRFCVMKSGGDFLIGCLIGFDGDSHFLLW